MGSKHQLDRSDRPVRQGIETSDDVAPRSLARHQILRTDVVDLPARQLDLEAPHFRRADHVLELRLEGHLLAVDQQQISGSRLTFGVRRITWIRSEHAE